MSYVPTIGLEIHAELKTQTKMFCNSKNDPDETRPNVNVCPVCMGHPGTLPVINKAAVKHVLKVGVAVGGTLADFTEWDRKSYFYPDIPKGYQISQYKHPLVTGGSIAIPHTDRSISITRIHLEEDTALNKHEKDYSLVDFNRAGIPLMELVTEPVIHSANDAVSFAKELQLLLRYLGVADANMEKGELRVEANVSVSPKSEVISPKLGAKVEVKNLNSFRSVARAIEYEIKRQIEVLDSGGMVVQETRGWDEEKQETFSQRRKEESHDYRYFPEPDLPKLKLSEIPEFAEEKLRAELPELPWEKRERYKKEFNDKDIEIFISNPSWGKFIEETIKTLNGDNGKIRFALNYFRSDIIGLMRWDNDRPMMSTDEIKVQSYQFAELINMIANGEITSKTAKEILILMVGNGGNPREIVEEHNLFQKSDEGELKRIAEQVIAENPKVVEEYKKGKVASLQFLVGQGMKLSKGSANPQVLGQIFKKLLS